MLINEIEGKKLKKPIKVKISKYYIAESDDLNLYAEGITEEEAINDLKMTVLDILQDIKNDDEYTKGGKEWKDKFLAYFQLDDHPKY